MGSIGIVLLALTAAGIAYQAVSAIVVWRFLRRGDVAAPQDQPPVTILKPLHGAEPRLAANLATFAAQDYPAVEIVCGVQSASDPAGAAIPPGAALVTDPTRHGSNAKVSNLVNMMAAASHDVLVLSDSDMSVRPDYLARVVAALGQPGIGAVTCLYHGRGDAGFWSRVAAMGISHGFLPSVVVGRALGLAAPCMGSTIALRRTTLEEIGGFAAFADVLADDYAIGEAVRGLGSSIAVPHFTIAHACAEASFGDLVRHELRWATTIRRLDPAGFVGSGLVNPLPIAALACVLVPVAWPALAAALAVRLAVAISVDRATGERAGPLWAVPLRDFISFGVFLASFMVQSVDWRGARLYVARDGRIRRDEA